jgi:hypothetical protein
MGSTKKKKEQPKEMTEAEEDALDIFATYKRPNKKAQNKRKK